MQCLVVFLKYANLEKGEEMFIYCPDSQEAIAFISLSRTKSNEF